MEKSLLTPRTPPSKNAGRRVIPATAPIFNLYHGESSSGQNMDVLDTFLFQNNWTETTGTSDNPKKRKPEGMLTKGSPTELKQLVGRLTNLEEIVKNLTITMQSQNK